VEPFLGQIQPFGFNFAPRGWAMCQGQLLSIAQNTALFSLLGTMYGGNGQTTFGLPDLRGRSLVGMGQGPGLTNIDQGEAGGTETTTLIVSQMPAHNHTATATSTLQGATEQGDKASPQGRMLASLPGLYYTPPQGGQTYTAMFNQAVLTSVTVAVSGGSQPIPLRNPYLGMNMCIATQGIFPSRN
jgi:microcystin-dependent protein